MMNHPDFVAAVASLPRQIKFAQHGRDLTEGLDCAGLLIAIYKAAGISIEEIDVPYGQADEKDPKRRSLLLLRLQLLFQEMDRGTPDQCNDGDVLLIEAGENHVGVVVRDYMIEMTKNGLRLHRLARIWQFVAMIYRHHKLLHTVKA